MSGPLALLALLAFDLSPDGWLLARQLRNAAMADHLPSAPLEAVAERLWLEPHERQGDLPAAFLSLDDLATGDPRPRIALHRGFVTLAPSLSVAPGDGTLEALPVDSAAALFGALIQAGLALDRFPGVSSAAGRAAVSARAQATFTDVPEPARVSVFTEAAVAFLGHALTVAHEIARIERHRRTRGATLCGRFAVRASHFGLWQHSVFGAGQYTGRFHTPDGWRRSRSFLSVDDRRWLLRAVLDAPWTGDPSKDFAWLCDS